MSKNVILVDHEVNNDWEYKSAIQNETHEEWTIISCVTNRLHGNRINEGLRYIKYFLFAFKVFLQRNQYNKVIAWQQFYGLILAFYCRVFHVKKSPDIYIMTFIYKQKKNKLYNKFVKYIVSSGYIKKLIVLSDSEKEYYASLFGISEGMFHCTRIGVPDVSKRIKKESNQGKYYLSVGRSNRDYAFLRKAWKPEYGKLIIVCDSYREPEKEGITCLSNCYGDDYLRLVANCYAEIIPLEDPKISSGSLSFLQAMMLSVPTVVTDNITVTDYISNGVNGFIIQKTNYDLEQAIRMLEDDNTYKEIAQNARKTYLDQFSEYSLGIDIGRMLSKQ